MFNMQIEEQSDGDHDPGSEGKITLLGGPRDLRDRPGVEPGRMFVNPFSHRVPFA